MPFGHSMLYSCSDFLIVHASFPQFIEPRNVPCHAMTHWVPLFGRAPAEILARFWAVPGLLCWGFIDYLWRHFLLLLGWFCANMWVGKESVWLYRRGGAKVTRRDLLRSPFPRPIRRGRVVSAAAAALIGGWLCREEKMGSPLGWVGYGSAMQITVRF